MTIRSILYVVIGILVIGLAVRFIYVYTAIDTEKQNSLKEVVKIDSALHCNKKSKYQDSVYSAQLLETKISLLTIEGKIVTLNTRFSDLYTLGTVIVTLLGLLILGIYVKTKHEVKAHLEDKYGEYKDTLEKKLSEAKELVGKINTELEQAKKLTSTPKTDNRNESHN